MCNNRIAPLPTQPPQAFLRQEWRKLAAFLFWLLLIGAYAWYAAVNALTPLAAARQLVTFLKDSLWGPLLYIAIYAVRPLVFFPATLLTVAAGAVYGPVAGFVLVVIASNISASVAWFVGRFFGGGLLGNTQASGVLKRYADRMRANSFETILMMRFIFLPYDLVNYLAGCLRIHWRPFILATIVGSIPGTLAVVGFGASVQTLDGVPQFNPWVLAVSAVILLVSIALSRLVRRREGTRA